MFFGFVTVMTTPSFLSSLFSYWCLSADSTDSSMLLEKRFGGILIVSFMVTRLYIVYSPPACLLMQFLDSFSWIVNVVVVIYVLFLFLVAFISVVWFVFSSSRKQGCPVVLLFS